MWSSDFASWLPVPGHDMYLGGSEQFWPQNYIDGDNREFLSFWGGNNQQGQNTFLCVCVVTCVYVWCVCVIIAFKCVVVKQ